MANHLGNCGCGCTGGPSGGLWLPDPNWRVAGQVYAAARQLTHVRNGYAPLGADTGVRYTERRQLNELGNGIIERVSPYNGEEIFQWSRGGPGGEPETELFLPYGEGTFEADADALLEGRGPQACGTFAANASQLPQWVPAAEPYSQGNPDGSFESGFLIPPSGDTNCVALGLGNAIVWRFYGRAKGTVPPGGGQPGDGEKTIIDLRAYQIGFWDPDGAWPGASVLLFHYSVPGGTRMIPNTGGKLPSNASFIRCEERNIYGRVETIQPPAESGYILVQTNLTGGPRCGVVNPPPVTTPAASQISGASQGEPDRIRVTWFNDEPWLKHAIYRTPTAAWNQGAQAVLVEGAHQETNPPQLTKFFGSVRAVYQWTYDDPTPPPGEHWFYWVRSYYHEDIISTLSSVEPGQSNEGWIE